MAGVVDKQIGIRRGEIPSLRQGSLCQPTVPAGVAGGICGRLPETAPCDTCRAVDCHPVHRVPAGADAAQNYVVHR